MARPDTAPAQQLLNLNDLLKDSVLHEVGAWWRSLSVVMRARGRWVFHEPSGLPYPRSRARNEILDAATGNTPLDDLNLPVESAAVERHNKCQWAPDIKGEPLEAWKGFALRTTNQEFQKVAEPNWEFGPGIWMRVMRKSHTSLLRPGGLDLIEAWATRGGASDRQRSALSELLWSFSGHLTSRRGQTETIVQYGWKNPDKAHVNIVDAYSSSMGRPSSAPIASAVQLKFEQKKREQAKAQVELAEKMKADRLARQASKLKGGFEKPAVDTLVSNVPFQWPGSSVLVPESSTQVQMKTVKPADLAMAIKWGVPAFNACPPATSGMGRCLGKKQYHGDAMYGHFWAVADKMYQPIDAKRRPWEIKGPAAAWAALDRRKLKPKM